MATLALILAGGLLLTAAWWDLRVRIIPDIISILLAIVGCAIRARMGWIEFAFSVFTALLLFFLLFALFSRSIIGGGDVKLAVAMALWLAPADCYVFLVATSLAGGVLALVYMLLRVLPSRLTGDGVVTDLCHGFWRTELARIRAGCALPYGVAIAAGGFYALLHASG